MSKVWQFLKPNKFKLIFFFGCIVISILFLTLFLIFGSRNQESGVAVIHNFSDILLVALPIICGYLPALFVYNITKYFAPDGICQQVMPQMTIEEEKWSTAASATSKCIDPIYYWILFIFFIALYIYLLACLVYWIVQKIRQRKNPSFDTQNSNSETLENQISGTN